MPLRAIIGNREVISTELTSDEWGELKKSVKSSSDEVILPCCHQPGNLRTSKLGLNHFYHKVADTCNYKPESAQHLKAKREIIKACHANNWNATPEYAQDDWIADVLATNDKRRLAFEVQWSKQTSEETIRRQERYEQSGVKGCWLMRTIPKELRNWSDFPKPDKNIPIFKIYEADDKQIMVDLEIVQLSVFEFINSLFKGEIKYCDFHTTKPIQHLSIRFYEKHCWKCHKPQHAYNIYHGLTTICGTELHVDQGMWDGGSLEKHPAIIQEVKQFQHSEEGKHLKIGEVKKRYSKTVREKYLSFGCFYCDAIFGDFFMFEESLEVAYDENLLTLETDVNLGTFDDEHEHWCFSRTKDFCKEK